MKVLFFTRKVDRNDSRIGFAHSWIEELAKNVEKLYVICLEKGEVELPKNVEVTAVGKNRLLRLFRLDWQLFSKVRKVDAVLCHMNPIYAIASAPYAKLFRKRLYMWHTHGKVTAKLKIAHFLADGLLTASRESVGIKSRKVIPMGHGIDTGRFSPQKRAHNGKIILSVGRISPIKKYEVIIKAMPKILEKEKDVRLVIVGKPPIESQEGYLATLKGLVREYGLEDNVEFKGNVPFDKISMEYQKADVFVSASETGSLDKTVLEAMSTETPAVASGEVYAPLGIISFKDETDLPGAVFAALALKQKKPLRQTIKKDHDLSRLMKNISEVLSK